jgi:hypothetical protein
VARLATIEKGAWDSPLPVTLEEALTEILVLRSILIREREQHMKLVERRELDARSMRGTIKSLREEVKTLKTESKHD